MTESLAGAFGSGFPMPAPGLYDPRTEHDSCGVAFVATLRGTPGRDIVDAALSALLNLDHRGAFGADMSSGDGAGIMTQIPDAFLRDVIHAELPPAGFYAVGMVFLPTDLQESAEVQERITSLAESEGLSVLAWRDVPVTADLVGVAAQDSMPLLRQLVVADPAGQLQGLGLDRLAYRLRKRTENELGVFFASLSARTLTYKGMLTTSQLEPFFPDLSDPRYASELALVHARFSTNTFPSWALAQPMRLVAHNGEFTGVRGNRDWMAGRQGSLEAQHLGDLTPLLPVCHPGGSDTMSFDEVVELLHLDGRSLPHAVLMMLPEAWEKDPEMGPERRAFYEYHAGVIEPWDGPANLNFTDGTLIGAVLDRNALRPGRFWVTEDGLVVLASETGVLDLDPATIVRKGRLEPGRMFLVDTRQGRIVEDEEIKSQLAAQQPYAQWLADHEVVLDHLPDGTSVDLDEAVPRSTFETELSKPSFFDRFRPLFAQGTTPPLEAEQEQTTASLRSAIGPEPNLLGESAEHARKIVLSVPILDNRQVTQILGRTHSDPAGRSLDAVRVSTRFDASLGGAELEARLALICARIDSEIERGVDVIVLSDRVQEDSRSAAPAGHAHAIPSGLVTSAVHRHLIADGTRSMVSLIVEAADVRHAHDAAVLLSVGAAAVNPYAALGSTRGLDSPGTARARLEEIGAGVAELMLGFGTSTIHSYRGAQAFEAFGLAQGVLDRFFTGMFGRVGSSDLDAIASEVFAVSGETSRTGAVPPAHSVCDLLTFDPSADAIDVDRVESVADIVTRFWAPTKPEDGRVAMIGPDRIGVDAAYLSGAEEILVRLGWRLRAGLRPSGPAPQHDIASLEDLAQTVHDLKNASPDARIVVEVDAQYGIGTIAVGATKAHADVVLVTGQDGPGPHLGGQSLNTLWEIGLAETQQTLVLNGVRDRITIRLDAELASGRDVVVAALLGADEFGFLRIPSTAPDGLRTEAFFTSIAGQVREHLAALGFATLADATGQTRALRPRDGEHGLDLTRLIAYPADLVPGAVRAERFQDHGLDRALDHQLIRSSMPALEDGTAVRIDVPIRNVNRSVGALLGHEVVTRAGAAGLPEDLITVSMTGSAGQSLGAFLPSGITLHLFGDANDFVGKGLCGGRIIVQPDRAVVLLGPSNILAGNVVGYGATSGEIFLRGQAGDRFAARNQGAALVAEGIGDHGCQAMSGGVVVVLGPTGRNLAAGLSGGSVYVLDLHPGAISASVLRRDVVVENLDEADVARVSELVHRHHVKSESRIAMELLAQPGAIAERFSKISPNGFAQISATRDTSATFDG